MSVKTWTQVQLEEAYQRMVKIAGSWEAVAREREVRIQELEKKIKELEKKLAELDNPYRSHLF